MKKRIPLFTVCFVIIMFVFAAVLTWYTVSMSSITAKTEDTRRQLEISRGREARQQSEYDKAVQDLPEAQAQLQELQPLVAQANTDTAVLKARRKELRAEKKSLQDAAGTDAGRETESDE